MALRITSRSEVSETLNKIAGDQTAHGVLVRGLDGPGWNVKGVDVSPDLEGIELNVWNREDYAGIVVFSEQTPSAEFNLNGGQRRSTTFATLNDQVWLLHTGRFYLGRSRPFWDDRIELDGRFYFKVSATDDPNFYENLFRYYLSRALLGPPDEEDLAEEVIKNDTSIKFTEKVALIKARRGQENTDLT